MAGASYREPDIHLLPNATSGTGCSGGRTGCSWWIAFDRVQIVRVLHNVAFILMFCCREYVSPQLHTPGISKAVGKEWSVCIEPGSTLPAIDSAQFATGFRLWDQSSLRLFGLVSEPGRQRDGPDVANMGEG